MSAKRIQVTTDKEEENYEIFAETLKKVMDVPPENRGQLQGQ